ncbi:MAG: hypothetical protein AAGI30_02625 [Planctomycetota bacterium]
MIVRISALAIALLAGVVPCASADVVVRTGERIEAEVLEVSLDGVVVRGGRALRIDEVRAVEGPMAEAWATIEDDADALWRARTRLQRDDAALACPVLREFADRFDAGDRAEVAHEAGSQTALLVAEGLVRCALSEGDDVSAARAWVRWRAEASGAARTPRLHFPGAEAIDRATGVCPRLMPLVVSEAAAEVLTSASRSGSAIDAVRRPGLDGPTSELLDAIARTEDDDAGARAAARTALARLTEQSGGTWREAWARTARGLSLLADASDDEARDAALLELAHVPARFSESLPELAYACRARLAAELARRGEHGAADAVAQPLRDEPQAAVARRWLDQTMTHDHPHEDSTP